MEERHNQDQAVQLAQERISKLAYYVEQARLAEGWGQDDDCEYFNRQAIRQKNLLYEDAESLKAIVEILEKGIAGCWSDHPERWVVARSQTMLGISPDSNGVSNKAERASV